MPEVGRFASPDTLVPDPSNPQSYNRYSYSYNNPINYTDPDGHCPQPSGEWANANIICVAGFIPTETSTGIPGLVYFQGDNRDFSGASQEDESRFWVWINADTGEIVRSRVHSTQEVSGPNGDPIGEPWPERDTPWPALIDWFYGSNEFSAELGSDGSVTFEYNVVCSHAICNNMLAPNGEITFVPNESGSYDPTGTVNKFPNLEAYHWMSGGLQSDYIFRLQNFSDKELLRRHANFLTSFQMSSSYDFE